MNKKQLPLNNIAKFFGILSIESRLLILHALMDKEKNVTELEQLTGLKQSNLSKQLKILTEEGLISRQPQYPEVYYSIANPLVFKLCQLVCDSI